MREVAEWNGRRLNHGSGIRFLDFLRDERIINFKAGKTTQMHRQKVCTSPAIASRWLTLTTTYTIDALARAYTHTHIYTSAHKLQQRRSTRRYRCTCVYVYAILDHVYICIRLITVSLHRVSVNWYMGQTVSRKVQKKEREEASNFLKKKASLVRIRKRVCLVETNWKSIGTGAADYLWTCSVPRKAAARIFFFRTKYTINKENGDC